MKKFLKRLVGIAGILSLTLSSVAFAQSVSSTSQALTSADVLPPNLDIVYQFNNGAKNPFSGMFKKAVQQSISSQILTSNEKFFDATAEKIVDNNTFTFGMTMSTPNNTSMKNEDMFITFNITKEDFDATITTDFIAETKSETLSGYTVYNNDDLYFTKVENLFIASNKKENLETLLTNYNKKSQDTLKNNPNYQKAVSTQIAGSFLNVYINPAFAFNAQKNTSEFESDFGSFGTISEIFNQGFLEKIGESVKAESFSVAQGDNGFIFNFTVQGDKAKLQALDMNFDKYNFTPELYKRISGKDLILYSEGNNLKAQFENIFKMLNMEGANLTEMNALRDQFKKETSLDLNEDVLAALDGKFLIAIHKTEQIYPSFTMLFDVKDSIPKTSIVLGKLSDAMKKAIQAEKTDGGKDIFDSRIATIGGTAYYEFTFNVAESMGEFSDLKKVPLEKTKLVLRMTITPDGILVISTHPHIEQIYTSQNGGLTSNEKFKKAFTNPDEAINSVMFVDIENIHQYITDILTIDASTSTPYEGRDEFAADEKKNIDEAFAPWHDLYIKSYATADISWANGTLNMDVEAVGNHLENLFNIGLSDNEIYAPEREIPFEDMGKKINIVGDTPFCDVTKKDWFFSAVSDLNDKEIVKGYKDGCFHPQQTVTRAEFITMLVGALDNVDYDFSGSKDINFKDVSNDDWFSFDVEDAAAEGLIKGFADGTFRPNNNITRAEAVEFLRQAFLKDGGPMPIRGRKLPFKDVTTGNWFYEAVSTTHAKGVISTNAAGKFYPNRLLTRAEAAQMIKKFIDAWNKSSATLPRSRFINAENQSPDFTPTSDFITPNDKPIEVDMEIHTVEKAEDLRTIGLSENKVLTYKVREDFNTACENQAKMIGTTSFQTSSITTSPIKTPEAWTQIFENGEMMIVLACTQDPNEAAKAMVTITRTKNTLK